MQGSNLGSMSTVPEDESLSGSLGDLSACESESIVDFRQRSKDKLFPFQRSQASKIFVTAGHLSCNVQWYDASYSCRESPADNMRLIKAATYSCLYLCLAELKV